MQRIWTIAAVASVGVCSSDLHAQTAEPVVILAADSGALLESRTPIDPPGEGEWLPAAASIVINTPGSYVLTGNILGVAGKHGIEIKKSNVTIDLNGYALIGVTDSKNGIFASTGVVNVKIHNGAIRGWGERGIAGKQMTASEVSDVRVGNCVLNGIHLGQGIVSGCTSRLNGKDGINIEHGKSVVESCAMEKNGGDGVEVGPYTRVRDVTSTGNDEHGIWADIGASISGCVASGNRLGGIVCGDHAMVYRCAANENTQDGIWCGQYASVVDCEAYSNSAGVRVEEFGSVRGCGTNVNGAGVSAQESSLISGCSANSNNTGISAHDGSLVESCTTSDTAAGGILLTYGGTVRGCTTGRARFYDTSFGIRAERGATVIVGNTCRDSTLGIAVENGAYWSRIENNNIAFCSTGIISAGSSNAVLQNSVSNALKGFRVTFAPTFIFHNMVSNSSTPYDVLGTQVMGTVRTTTAGAGPWDNFDVD